MPGRRLRARITKFVEVPFREFGCPGDGVEATWSSVQSTISMLMKSPAVAPAMASHVRLKSVLGSMACEAVKALKYGVAG